MSSRPTETQLVAELTKRDKFSTELIEAQRAKIEKLEQQNAARTELAIQCGKAIERQKAKNAELMQEKAAALEQAKESLALLRTEITKVTALTQENGRLKIIAETNLKDLSKHFNK